MSAWVAAVAAYPPPLPLLPQPLFPHPKKAKMNATDTMAFVDSEYDIFYIVSKDGDDYNSWEWCFTNNIDPIKYRGGDGDEPVPEWLIKKYEEQIREEKKTALI